MKQIIKTSLSKLYYNLYYRYKKEIGIELFFIILLVLIYHMIHMEFQFQKKYF